MRTIVEAVMASSSLPISWGLGPGENPGTTPVPARPGSERHSLEYIQTRPAQLRPTDCGIRGGAQVRRSLTPVLEGCRVFHFDDVSGDAPAKGWSTIGDDLSLRSNAENIAAYLLRVREDHSRHYQRIVAAVRAAAPFFDDFVLEPSPNERIRLRWRQRGLDRTFLAREASDGMLRFICLATLLLGPDRPATIILDEPELGLHPAAIHLLAEMARIAGRNGHKVILATQSVPLVSHFELGEIIIVDRVDGATAVHRPDEDLLGAFLDDYSTGTLWEMNLLGGRPSHTEAAL